MKTWKVPADIDPECVAICEAMNRMPGIRTIESCCGHGRHSFNVYFKSDSLEALPDLLYWFDVCHSGFGGWRVTVRTDCAASPATFVVEGPVGAFSEADEIAKLIVPGAEEETS